MPSPPACERDRTSRFAAALAALLLSACASVVPGTVIGPGQADFDFRKPCTPEDRLPVSGQLAIRYLGSGGLAIEWKDEIILFGPFFSNPSALAAMFCNVRWDERRIDEGLRAVETARVRAVLAGHSHYDHLGDVPAVMKRLPASAVVYVNDVGASLLTPYSQLDVRSYERMSEPVRIGSAFRMRAFRAGHAPQFCLFGASVCFRFAADESIAASKTPWEQRRIRHLAGGVAHAFLVELMDGETVRFRIYYNDSASSVRDLQLPAGVTADVAILCLPGWQYVEEYPRAVVTALRPRHVIVSHYEDFFVRSRGAWRFPPTVTKGRVAQFLELLNALRRDDATTPVHPVCGPSNDAWTMPVPGAQVVFAARP